jgi:hypothetical protein
MREHSASSTCEPNWETIASL